MSRGAELAAASARHVLHSLQATPPFPVLKRGQGARVWDVDGNEYLDAVAGTNGPAMVGHSHPEVADAVARQMRTLPSHSTRHDSEPVVEFATELARIAPGDLNRTLLCAGGAEAIEAAIKLALHATGRSDVLSLTGGFHGMSLAAMGLCDLHGLKDSLPDGRHWPGFEVVPAHDAHALEGALEQRGDGRVAAVVLELAQGAGGQIVLDAGCCRAVRRLCDERGIVLIVDEIQTGLGRLGSRWACDRVGIEPDILVTGKAFGGGVPFGAISVRDNLVDAGLEAGRWHMLTFMNQPLQAAAGMAVMRIVERDALTDRARRLGQCALSRFHELARRYEVVGEVRGAGLFLGLELVTDRMTGAPAVAACREAWHHAVTSLRLLTWFSGVGNVLAFKPALNVPDGDFEEILGRVEAVVSYVDALVRR